MTISLEARDLDLYGGIDPREHPRYSFTEAAKAIHIPVSTLRSWVRGQSYRTESSEGYFEPIISSPSESDKRLSFTNLIEAHALRALREVHGISLQYIRQALDIAQIEYGIERLLVSPLLRAKEGQLFLDSYTHLLELSEAKQYAMRSILAEYLQRVDFDEKLPASFFPFARFPSNFSKRIIVLSPFISFGRPVIRRIGVTTQTINQRLEAGETMEVVLKDYNLKKDELEEAILYEAAS